MQKIKNEFWTLAANLEKELGIHTNNNLALRKENILSFLERHKSYSEIVPFINDFIHRMENIKYSYERNLFEFLEKFSSSKEENLIEFIDNALYVENKKLKESNEKLVDKTSSLYRQNRELKKLENKYNKDGSSIAVQENKELKAEVNKLKAEINKLKDIAKQYEILDMQIEKIKKIKS